MIYARIGDQVNGELTKLEIGNISKLIAAVYITDADFRKILLKSVMGAFKTSHQNTNIQYGFGGTKPDQHAIDYLQERVFILSDKTTSKLEGDLRFELIAGLKNNESISEITKRLDNIFSDMMPYQLERIARTEIIDAQNGGRISAYKASDVVEYKMWIAAKGGKGKRVCALCARLNGQIQPLGKPFIDPETGESWQHPVAHPNGRCTTVPLRKIPDNIIYVGGQVYAGDQVVGKVEINVGSLSKTEKRIWVKPTPKKIGYWRRIKSVSEKPDIKPKIEEREVPEKIYKDYYESIDFTDQLNEYGTEYPDIEWDYIEDSWKGMVKFGKNWNESNPVKEFNNVVKDCINNNNVYGDMLDYISVEDSHGSIKLGEALNIIFGTDNYIHGDEDTKKLIRNSLDEDYLLGIIRIIKLSHQILDKMYPDVTEIKLYRGIKGKIADNIKETFKKDKECKIDLGSLSSWTSSGLIPYDFAGKDGVVLNSKIDKKKIVMCWPMYVSKITKNESEFTIRDKSINLTKNNITWGIPL